MGSVKLRSWRAACRLLIALAAAASLAGCGGGGSEIPAPPELTRPRTYLNLFAGDQLNTCGGDYANALVVKVYQLSGDAQISIAALDRLIGNEREALGDELISEREVVLEPRARLEIDVLQEPDARFLAVVGNFCETRGDCWRWVRPMDDLSGAVTLVFGASCIDEQ